MATNCCYGCPAIAMVVASDTTIAMEAYYCHIGCYGYLLLLWMPTIAILAAKATYCCYGCLLMSEWLLVILLLLWMPTIAKLVAMDTYCWHLKP